MKSSIRWILASAIVPMMAIAGHSTTANAQVVYYPTDAYVAGYTPYYYNGYAHYLYRNNWYYRDHLGWHGYGHEPIGLYGQRGAWERTVGVEGVAAGAVAAATAAAVATAVAVTAVGIGSTPGRAGE